MEQLRLLSLVSIEGSIPYSIRLEDMIDLVVVTRNPMRPTWHIRGFASGPVNVLSSRK